MTIRSRRTERARLNNFLFFPPAFFARSICTRRPSSVFFIFFSHGIEHYKSVRVFVGFFSPPRCTVIICVYSIITRCLSRIGFSFYSKVYLCFRNAFQKYYLCPRSLVQKIAKIFIATISLLNTVDRIYCVSAADYAIRLICCWAIKKLNLLLLLLPIIN